MRACTTPPPRLTSGSYARVAEGAFSKTTHTTPNIAQTNIDHMKGRFCACVHGRPHSEVQSAEGSATNKRTLLVRPWSH